MATFYSTGQIASLVAFVMREKTIVQQDYILFDLTGTSWSQEHILSAVQQLRRFAVSRLIFIASPSDETAFLYGRLASFRIDDLITAGRDIDIPEAVRKCLAGEDGGGMDRRLSAMRNAISTTAARAVAPLKIPEDVVFNIAVGGAMPRIGTTTQAIGLFHYLKRLGFAPCLFDPDRRLLDLLLPLYREQTVEAPDHVAVNAIPFCTVRNGRFNAYIRDLGVVAEETRAVRRTADLFVLVGGTKPWELPALAAAVALLKEGPGEMATLLSFSAEGDAESVGKYLGSHSASVPYAPDIWTSGPATAYQEAVLPCLQALCTSDRQQPS